MTHSLNGSHGGFDGADQTRLRQVLDQLGQGVELGHFAAVRAHQPCLPSLPRRRGTHGQRIHKFIFDHDLHTGLRC